ncbi:MAG: aldo/keto reductase [Planctomycetota bacterium]|nr:MAG: aldo/keto reductase [Planctomycetota bacterium]REK35667.1 MAG: aldo/keto reductase [Planctomycetota bacterium]
MSAIAFGAGPVPELMTGDDQARRTAVVRHAIAAGINWFDTAATYGNGSSEAGLGAALSRIPEREQVHIATKVRLAPEDLDDIPGAIERSMAGSLQRLQCRRVTLVQLHNSMTAKRGDEPTSVTPADILGAGGVLESFQRLQADGVVEHIGLTALGQPAAMKEVISTGEFATIQVPYNLLNPSAGQDVAADFPETDYGNIIAAAAEHGMGVFAIRVFAGGALAGQPPSRHTHTTKFFPLDLYVRDQERCREIAQRLPEGANTRETAVRFVLSHAQVTSAIIGFGEPSHIDEAVASLAAGPLSEDVLSLLEGV